MLLSLTIPFSLRVRFCTTAMYTALPGSESCPGSCSLINLAPETLSLVLNFCSISTLRALFSTCKTLRAEIFLPLKYRSVDLSVHNRGRIPTTDHNGNIQYYWSDQFPPRFDLEDLSRKQHAFLSAVLSRPYIGKLIHDLTWTLRSYCDPDGFMPGKQTKDAVWPDTHMWDAFKTFTNVTKLDLACYQETWDWAYLRDPPSPLFPAATHIRLSGVMYPEIVMAILHPSSLSNLRHLSLDNLQDPGPCNCRWPKDCSTSQDNFNYYTRPFDPCVKVQRLPGTMRYVLPRIEQELPALTSFHYRKPGWVHNRVGRNPAADIQCYAEVASFISCVSPTLQSFHFEQGVSERLIPHVKAGTVEQTFGCILPPPQDKNMKPMDERFVKIVLPAIMRNKWPRLRELKIQGLGEYKGRQALNRMKKWRLMKHMGDGVQVVVEDVTEKPCVAFLPS